MTFGTRPTAPPLPRPVKLLVAAVALVVAVVVLFGVFAGVYTDFLWFRSVHFGSVFTTRLGTQALLFVVFGAVMAVIVAANVAIAYRLRPTYRPASPEQQALDRYRVLLGRRRGLLLAVVTLVVGLAEGSNAATHWKTWLLWRNGVPFGTKDAQFHRDISYFAFTYPMQRLVLGTLFAAVLLALVAAVVTHYLYGGLRLQTPGTKVTSAARTHLAVLLGVFVLLKAAAYWLDRYGLAFSPRGVVTGPSYTDVNAVLPAKTTLAVIAVICALLFFATVFRRSWTLPAVAFGLMVLSAIVVGGVYPAIVQQFQVKPSEADKEAPYIARNIAATRQAYGIGPDMVKVSDYSGTPTQSNATVRSEVSSVAQVRLLDPSRLSDTWKQLQQQRSFYAFPDSLDIDRYHLSGRTIDSVVAAREVNVSNLGPGQDNWINRHLVYTHGFGFVAADANTVDPEGKPSFIEKDIPPTGKLPPFQPRIYFGEQSPTYSVVGAPAGAVPRELDRPGDTGTGQVNNTYSGKGGVPMGSLWRRLLFATKYREKNLLLSSAINGDSKILFDRDPRVRVKKVAPWLTLDGDPYPAVVDGRILWIIDGYTTSDGYPYSQRTSLGEATADTLTSRNAAVQRLANDQVNYIRNSVKATVDAYDGTVTLYEWDKPFGQPDPVLQAWKRAFPGVVQPESAIPPDLQAHFRYPEDLFKVQRDLLARYHVTDPQAFYNGTDFWKVPDDPTVEGATSQPPYYLTIAVGDEPSPVFSLTTTFVATKRPNLTAFMSVSSDPSRDYGVMRLLQLPRNTVVNGPGQVQNNFESYPKASESLALLRRGGSSVVFGNLLTIPVGQGLLYVEPVYVQASGGESYPTLQKVLAAFGDSLAYENSLSAALDAVFGTKTTPTTPSGPTGPPVSGPASAALTQAIADAQAAYAAGQAALAKSPPDFAAYGEAQKRLADALARIQQLSKSSASPAPSPSSSPSATASP